MSIWRRGFWTLIALLLGLPVAYASEYEPLPMRSLDEAGNRFYQNPLPVYDIGDPFIVPENNQLCMFATGGSIGFNVWRTTDLRSFDKQKALPKVIWASGDYWAPEVYAYGGRYVMLFTARRKSDKSLRIGIAFSDKAEGPYEDPLGAPLFDLGYATIDATLFMDGDIPYLYFVRDCSENIVNGIHESHINGVQLSADLLSMIGEPTLLTKPDQAWEMEAGGEYLWNEGPAVLPHDGRYYLFYSAHYFADKRYGVGVAVADSPLGPYAKQENNPLLRYIEDGENILVSGPGHNSFFTLGGELFTAYHTHTYPLAPSGNRQLNIDRAGFHADGTAFINGPTRAAELLPLAMTGLVNYAPLATVKDTALTDGDACASIASADYAWRGTEAYLKWDEPCVADMVIFTFVGYNAANGRLILNDKYAIDFESSQANGGEAIFYFAPMAIDSLRIEWDNAVSAGELYVLGVAGNN